MEGVQGLGKFSGVNSSGEHTFQFFGKKPHLTYFYELKENV